MGFADLHFHSRFSDGLRTPAELIGQAARLGYAAVALTDHDTLDGIPEALAAAPQGLEVIAGVEITCRCQDQEVHLLGYFFGDTWKDAGLQAVLEHSKKIRAQRIGQIVARLNELGVALTTDEVTSRSDCGVLGRPHVAAALQQRGVVTSTEEAFNRFLKRGRPAYVERYRMTAAEAIGHVRRAGGVPVLAHPGLQPIDKRLPELADQGLAGLEVWHPQHAPAATGKYARLAAKLHLLATGGSDTHTDLPGPIKVPLAVVENLRQFAATILPPRP